MDPGRVESGNGKRASALDLGAVALTKLLHFVATLDGGFGRRSVGAALGDGVGDLLPVRGFKVAAAEGVPLVAVGVDEGEGLIGGPAGRRKAAGGGRSGDGGGEGDRDEGEGESGGRIGWRRMRRRRGHGRREEGMRKGKGKRLIVEMGN